MSAAAELSEPSVFTRDLIGWAPWLPPLEEAELTEAQRVALVDPARAKSPYFMLLVRDPEILGTRTRTDKDIFYNVEGGLPRAERELAAVATSRLNGCIFCASVHARFAVTHSGRAEEIDRILAEGIDTGLDPRWRAIVDAAAALTATPVAFGPEHVTALRAAGLGDDEIVDVIQSAAFFNWANRLMLSLGAPTPPGA